MQSSEIVLGDKIYRLRRPVLGLLQKYNQLQTIAMDGESIAALISDQERYKTFSEMWPGFIREVIENGGDELSLDKITLPEAISIIAGFFVYGVTANRVRSILSDSGNGRESGLPQNTISSSSSIPSQTETSRGAVGSQKT